MKLANLFNAMTDVQLLGDPQVDVSGLCCDSRKATTGDLFFALPGVVADGRLFAAKAVDAGAVAVVYEGELSLPSGIVGIRTENARQTMAHAAARFYDQPAQKMTIVGVTGTNGKTTVTTLLEQVLQALGRRPAVVGTIDYRFEEDVTPAPHTTPESIDLMALAARFQASGADTLILEVSSHALEQHRVDGLAFDLALFTNLTPEHLDYHGDMERYFTSKERLFSDQLKEGAQAVVNVDDTYGQRLQSTTPAVTTFAVNTDADVVAAEIEQTVEGIRGQMQIGANSVPFSSPLVGAFNLSNLLATTAAATALGFTASDICEALEKATGAAGRMERIATNCDALVVVDYAHTGDALEKALQALVAMNPTRILTVFGCGGDRDNSKRPVMGHVAGKYSDRVFLTSDNPRSEDPQKILQQVEVGLKQEIPPAIIENPSARGYQVFEDRREAIQRAVTEIKAGDLLLVAGKGHEDYQILAQGRVQFDDREEVRLALRQEGKSA